jgi:hypothetical protein
MIEELYDALKEAGASDEKARAAARTLANFETRFSHIDQRFTQVEGTQRLHSWMLGTLIALNIAILFRVFSVFS